MKRFIPIIIPIIILIVILFFWQEELSLQKQINATKFSAFATFFATILTAITVYLIYNQNKNIQKQIDQANKNTIAATKPDLYPTELKVSSSEIIRNYDNSKTPVFEVMDKDYKSTQSAVQGTITTKLYNIGLAAAKEIRITWEYDSSKVDELIRNIYTAEMNFEPYTKQTVIDFIPQNGYVELDLPTYFVKSLGPAINDGWTKNQPIGIESKLALKLFISYLDIYNNEYLKKFEVNITGLLHFRDIKFIQLA